MDTCQCVFGLCRPLLVQLHQWLVFVFFVFFFLCRTHTVTLRTLEFIKSRTMASDGHRAEITDHQLLCGGTYWSNWKPNSPVFLSASLWLPRRIQTLLETLLCLIFHRRVPKRLKECKGLLTMEYWLNDTVHCYFQWSYAAPRSVTTMNSIKGLLLPIFFFLCVNLACLADCCVCFMSVSLEIQGFYFLKSAHNFF